MLIYLDRLGGLLAEARCGIPGIDERAARFPILPCTGLGFSCLHCYRRSGELLPHLFTLTPRQARGGLFSVTLSVATGCPATPSFSRGILPDGVRTFLSSIRTSEHPHAEADAQHPAGEALEKQVWSKGVGSMVGCFAREQAGLLLRYPYLHAKIPP